VRGHIAYYGVPTNSHAMRRSLRRSLEGGTARSCDVVSVDVCPGYACGASWLVGFLGLRFHTRGLPSALTLEPEVIAQCGSPARWDLCGGPSEP